MFVSFAFSMYWNCYILKELWLTPCWEECCLQKWKEWKQRKTRRNSKNAAFSCFYPICVKRTSSKQSPNCCGVQWTLCERILSLTASCQYFFPEFSYSCDKYNTSDFRIWQRHQVWNKVIACILECPQRRKCQVSCDTDQNTSGI